MVKKYFAGANTASGYINLMDNNLCGIKNIYGISGRSKKQITEILSVIISEIESKYEDIECIISPFDITNIDAVIIRDTKTALVDIDMIPDKKDVKILKLDRKTDKEIETVSELRKKEKWAFEELYKAYQKGKVIHDEWERIYIQNMDYSRLEAYEKGIIDELFKNKSSKEGTQNYPRFFGASTPDGSVNYIDDLTENLSARYFIKGRPGTGKSTFLKKVAAKAQERGFDTEIYYCSFDKDSLDMVIVPKLSFCIFDSTAPHEMFPASKRDVILDFYQESGLSGVDEKFSRELSDVGERYRQSVAEGMAYLRLGKLFMREEEYHYSKQKNENELEKIKNIILADIM